MAALVETVTETELLPEMDPLLAETESQADVFRSDQFSKDGLRLVNVRFCVAGINGPPAGPKIVEPALINSNRGSMIFRLNCRLCWMPLVRFENKMLAE